MNTPMAMPEFLKIMEMILGLGPIGLILILWYFGKQQTDAILQQYREDMLEQRQMYENNVELVKRYEELAGDLKDVIILNSTAMAKLVDRIDNGSCHE